MVMQAIITLMLVGLGILFALGKGAFLIAGYNTMSEKEKAKYDEKKLMKNEYTSGTTIVIPIRMSEGTRKTSAFFRLSDIIRIPPECARRARIRVLRIRAFTGHLVNHRFGLRSAQRFRSCISVAT